MSDKDEKKEKKTDEEIAKTKAELAAEVRRLKQSKVMKEHRAMRKWQRDNV
tara:strand:+ start:1980 stop:2132 length:153 start_codon:yes stop_codon:yes gene_type:complete